MRRYAHSPLRVLLLTGTLVAAALVARSFAQDAAPAPAAPTAAPTVPAPAEGFGLDDVVGLVMRHPDAVFITIAILSVAGLTLIIQGFIKNRDAVFMPPATVGAIRSMIENRQFRELLDFTERDLSFISRVLNPALKRAPSFPAMKEAMETAIGEQTAEQFRRIEYLNIIGNLGPLLGLLGTVLGMIYAFLGVEASQGRADVSILSGGIATALVHTLLGLVLAVPCLAAFGVLRTIVDRLTVRGALLAEEMLLMIKPAEPRPAGAAAPAAPVAAAPGQRVVGAAPLPSRPAPLA
jgi:biopolymer transport protein ExbB